MVELAQVHISGCLREIGQAAKAATPLQTCLQGCWHIVGYEDI